MLVVILLYLAVAITSAQQATIIRTIQSLPLYAVEPVRVVRVVSIDKLYNHGLPYVCGESYIPQREIWYVASEYCFADWHVEHSIAHEFAHFQPQCRQLWLTQQRQAAEFCADTLATQWTSQLPHK